ncbi:uncharacterized protein [Lepisosteus oculatus]|uniref:uncharacterized protein isoform X2 n=1 Tax=Lepisosteus oculatus TaxID=7918 RepID=UPI00073FEC7C|nr:PREDICTED: uncharacterized protein LOC107077367 isoform X2 [Lepisosteus oculatus]
MSSSSSRHRERSSEAKEQRHKKKRCDSSNRENKDERRFIRKSKSPVRAPIFFKPRLSRSFIKPRYKREDHAFRKPGFSFRFRRYRSVSVVRSHRTLPPKNTSSPSPGSKSDLKKDNKCSKGTSKDQNDVQKSFKSKSREKEPEIFSIKVTEDGLSNTELPPSVMRAALRNRAIQQKRREIEEFQPSSFSEHSH